jgi:hypothetical protein
VITEKRCTIPSKVAPYPARPDIKNEFFLRDQNTAAHEPRFPMAQTAGQNPETVFEPGSDTDVTIIPPVKQNLFHDDMRPPV